MNTSREQQLKAELKIEKKTKKLMKKSAWAAGLGIGLLLLKFLVTPFIGDNEQAQKALFIFGWCLVAYGAITVLSFMFLKKFMFKINMLMTWVIMPMIFVKLLMSAL